MLKTEKSVKLDDDNKINGFNSYMGVCRVNVTSDKVAEINSILEAYPQREQLELASKNGE